MNQIQKIVTAISVAIFLSYLLIGESTPNRYELEVVYNDHVTTTIVSQEEFNSLQLRIKGNLNIYFDGEYFFQDVPSNKDIYKARIIGHNIIEGTSKAMTLLIIFLLFLLAVVFFSTDKPDQDHE